MSRLQRCTGARVSEWTPAGVLTIFENRSGAGVDFLRKGRSRSGAGVSFFEYEVSLLIDYYYCCRLFFFTKHVIM